MSRGEPLALAPDYDAVMEPRPNPSRSRRAFIACVIVALVAPLLGLGATALLVSRAFRGADEVPPEQRAARLASGISEGMNGVAGGGVVSIVAGAAAIVLALRARRERAREGR